MKNTNISNPAEKWVSDTNHEKIEELKLVSLETIISHNIFSYIHNYHFFVREVSQSNLKHDSCFIQNSNTLRSVKKQLSCAIFSDV